MRLASQTAGGTDMAALNRVEAMKARMARQKEAAQHAVELAFEDAEAAYNEFSVEAVSSMTKMQKTLIEMVNQANAMIGAELEAYGVHSDEVVDFSKSDISGAAKRAGKALQEV
jgi:hypothetical protein